MSLAHSGPFFPLAPFAKIPPLDDSWRVQHKGNRTCIEIDLPGRSKEDVTITSEGGNLYIKVEETEGLHTRKARSFTHKLKQGQGADIENIHAMMENGVLSITISTFKAKSKPVKIPIS